MEPSFADLCNGLCPVSFAGLLIRSSGEKKCFKKFVRVSVLIVDDQTGS